eukprot:TRINITY_DN6944_c0_g1_i12.p1 TRINITY_DN6944_c0_g1~~TRINITY_DN6944_c0_g1_i12.p1  ORF type:complete len:254 (-),score=3.28 TRINITY_DN6944_c0_g1_i12:97-831(-)
MSWQIWTSLFLAIISFHTSYPQSLRFDKHNRVQMGVQNAECDDATYRLEVDWFDDPRNFTCYHPNYKFLPIESEPVLECDNLPSTYYPNHFCMNTPLQYDHPIPTHGDHRPLWPMFGEYKFVPTQRWLHNIEHGAVVMLYHPCTHHNLVEKLRRVVTGCLRKHVITPHYALTREKPLALVAWGCRMLMSEVDEVKVTDFIKKYALKGPEGDLPKEGQYTHALIKKAEVPRGSDLKDSVLCPNYV